MAQNPFLESKPILASTDFSDFITNTLFVRFQLLRYRLVKTMTLSPFTRRKKVVQVKPAISWAKLLRRILKSKVVKKRLSFLFTVFLRKRFHKKVRSLVRRTDFKFLLKTLLLQVRG